MQTQFKIVVWGACNFEKMPKTSFGNVGDVHYKSSKNQTDGERDLKYSSKWLLGYALSDLRG